jgi:hypothetical protein
MLPARDRVAHRPVGRFTHAALLAGVMTTVVALAGCGSSSDDDPAGATAEETSTSDASSGDGCATVDVPVTPIEAHDSTEPALAIPEPPGWTRNTTQDSEIIRYVLVNEGLTSDSFTPNVVVTLEHIPGTEVSAESVLEQQRTVLQSQGGVTDIEVQPTTTCGSTAEKTVYTLPAMGAVPERPARGLLVAAPYGGDMWSATVTAQAVNGDDSTYQQDISTILDGFQMTAPAGG